MYHGASNWLTEDLGLQLKQVASPCEKEGGAPSASDFSGLQPWSMRRMYAVNNRVEIRPSDDDVQPSAISMFKKLPWNANGFAHKLDWLAFGR